MDETKTPVITIQSESAKASIENLSKALTAFSRSLSSIYSSDQFIGSAALLSALSNSMSSIAEKVGISQSAFDFLKELDFQNEHIELTEEDCDSINKLSKLSSTENPVIVTPNGKTPTVQFIISILIPIIIGFLQLWQNECHYKQDSIVEQNAKIQEQERYEQMMQSLSDIIDSLNDIQESQESCPCSHSDVPVLQDEAPTDTPDAQSQDDFAE